MPTPGAPFERLGAPFVSARIIDGPLTPEAERAAHAASGWTPARDDPAVPGQVGAMLRFEGVVRRAEPCEIDGGQIRDLMALDYQTYDPMAERELLRLAHDVASRHGVASLVSLHSRGRVNVGQVSFVLMVESPHRSEAIAAIAAFIDRMKQDVPIWKRPIWK